MDSADNEKLVTTFGAQRLDDIADLPDHYAFERGLIYSHRDLPRFLKNLNDGKRCAIVSGVNASGILHIGHKAVFDTVLYFQQERGCDVFVPISDDESFVARKVETQKEGLDNARRLAKEFLAYGFNPAKTFIIIDQLCTDIYNLAFRYSIKVTLSEIRAVYGYTMEDNPGLCFYPAVQAAHVLLPFERGYDDVLVPIGPDEDSHLRMGRDMAARSKVLKPAVVHLTFMPGLDGEKMSKSRNNTIDLHDDAATVKKKVNKALSGGQPTVEEHRKFGGDPDVDISMRYLRSYFLDVSEIKPLEESYRAGKLLSGDVKKQLIEHLHAFTGGFQQRLAELDDATVDKCLLRSVFTSA